MDSDSDLIAITLLIMTILKLSAVLLLLEKMEDYARIFDIECDSN